MYGRDAMATHPGETERLITLPQKKHRTVVVIGAGAAVDRPSRCRRRTTLFEPTGKQARLLCVAIGIVIVIAAASFAWMMRRNLGEELLPTTTLPQEKSTVLEATFTQPPQHEAAVVGAVIDADREEANSETTAERKKNGIPPNVIFILLDDMGMNDFGFRSTDLMEMTPYIDGLAGRGVRLDNYYTNHICTPARVREPRKASMIRAYYFFYESSFKCAYPITEILSRSSKLCRHPYSCRADLGADSTSLVQCSMAGGASPVVQ